MTTSFRATGWRAAGIRLASLIGFTMVLHAAPQPALFTHGKDVRVTSTCIGPEGGVLHTGKSGTPVDGITIKVPAGALKKKTCLTLSHNTGKLSLPRGTGSGVFLRMAAEEVLEFEKPLEIQVSFNPAQAKGHVLVGYAIDDKGRLAPVDSGPQNRAAGTATFLTLVPLLFTWVYAPL